MQPEKFTPMPPLVLSIAEACRVSNLSRSFLYEKLKSREIESVRVGGRRLIPVSALKKALGLEG